MRSLVADLKTLDEQMQVELLRDYLKESKENGLWHQARAIEVRLAELALTNPCAVAAADKEAKQEYEIEKQRRDNQYKNSFVEKGID